MSAPPAYDSNPDRRTLPAGWITQYDPNYKAWFYVNTEARPPVTTWNHPLGPISTPSPEPRRYSPPPVPPMNNNFSTYSGGYNPAGGHGNYPSQNSYAQQQQQPHFGGYGDSRGSEYEQNHPQHNEQRGLGGILGRFTGGHTGAGHTGGGNFGDEGRFGGRPAYGGGGYPAQQPQVVYVEQQQPQKKSGIGMGGLALGVGGGLLGGALLANAFDNDNDNDYGGGDYGDGGDDDF